MKTVVDVAYGKLVVEPAPRRVVLVDPATVDPATCVLLVVVPSGIVVAVVDVDVDVPEELVVVSFGSVVVVVLAVVDVLVVVVFSLNDVVVGGKVVEVVVEVVVVLVHVHFFVVLVGDDVVVDEYSVAPQNFTLEMSGVFPFPTSGRPAFENCPLYCGGAIEVTTDASPPFTITAETARVDAHVPPEADALVIVTTFSFPDGASKEYPFE